MQLPAKPEFRIRSGGSRDAGYELGNDDVAAVAPGVGEWSAGPPAFGPPLCSRKGSGRVALKGDGGVLAAEGGERPLTPEGEVPKPGSLANATGSLPTGRHG